MTDTIIQGVQDYFRKYIDMVDEDAPLWVNYLKAEPVGYSIVPLGGTRKVSEYIHGNSGEREFGFALQSSRFTSDDVERIGNHMFFEVLAEWLDDQTELGNLPSVPVGFAASGIEALGYGFLFEQGGGDTGIYQIQCRLEFSKL